MTYLDEAKNQLEEIRNSNFIICKDEYDNKKIKYSKLLKKAVICFHTIHHIGNSSEELFRIAELNDIMKNKFKELNPNFSEKVLTDMTYTYHKPFIKYSTGIKFPIDILVVDDAVFQKVAEYDDNYDISNIETFMPLGYEPYYNVNDIRFTTDYNNRLNYDNELSIEAKKATSKVLSQLINQVFGENITKPKYELNTDTRYVGVSGLTGGEVKGVNVYINKSHDDIGKHIFEKKECNIKFCTQKDDDITLYTVHQSYSDNYVSWTIKNINEDIWKLTKAASKNKNNNKNKVKTKKRNER